MKNFIGKTETIAFSFFILFIAIANTCHGQVPYWVKNGAPHSTSGNYYYAMGNGETLEEAIYTTVKSGVKLQGFTAITDQKIERSLQIKDNKRTSNHTSIGTLNFDDKEVNIFIADQYYDYSQQQYYVLIGFTKNQYIQPPQKPTLNVTNYLWRSALVPGWGQFYRGKTVKGVGVFLSEATLVTSAIYCEMRRSDNYRKSQETTNITLIKEYRKRSDNWEVNRNILIGGTIGIYAFNLLDAALAKGQIKYAWIPQNIDLMACNNNQVNYFGVNIKF